MGFFKAMGRAECCEECKDTPCDPCTPPVCSAALDCQTRSASGSKPGPPGCAWPSFDGDGRWWMMLSVTNARSASGSYHCNIAPDEEMGAPGSTYSSEYSTSDNWSTRTTCDRETNTATCELLSGSYTAAVSQTYSFGDGDPETTNGSKAASMPDCYGSDYWLGAPVEGDFSYSWPDDPAVYRYYFENDGWPETGGVAPWEVLSATTRRAEFSGSGSNTYSGCTAGGAANCSWSKVMQETLSDEWTPETTEDLISRVTGDLGSWGSGGCTAARHLSEDESAFSLTEGRMRVKHPRSSTGRLSVTIQVVTTPDEGAETVDTLTYNWTGSPDGEDIVGGWIDIPTPGTNGSVEATIIEVECNP